MRYGERSTKFRADNKTVYLIIPVYNTAPYLRRCLDSIFAQTYSNVFLLCVDDGSTDDSLIILREYEAAHSNMWVGSKENGGSASARNLALAMLPKEGYCTCFDSDDCCSPDYIEYMVQGIISNDGYDALVLADGCANEQADTAFCISHLLAGKKRGIQMLPARKLWKNALIRSIRFNECLAYSDDVLWEVDCFLVSKNVRIINGENKYKLCYNPTSVTHQKASNNKLLCNCESWIFAYEHIYPFIDVFQVVRISLVPFLCNEYLELLCYFDQHCSESEKQRLQRVRTFFSKKRLIWKPVSKHALLPNISRVKKKIMVYRYLRPFYKFISQMVKNKK